MAKRKPLPRGPQLELSGALGVAFANTAGARPNNAQQGVESYADLLTWSLQADVLGAVDAERLRRRASERPEEAAKAFTRVMRLRAVLSRLFVAIATEKDLPSEELSQFNAALSKALPALCVVPGDQGPIWGWAGDEGAFDRMLWPVLHSAAQLLVSVEGKPMIRQCGAKNCRLWFIDRSPSRQRRWCDMKICGNRQKALRHYYRDGKRRRESVMRRSGAWKARRPRERTEI